MHLLTLWFTTYLGNPFETNFGTFCTSANYSPKLLSRLPRVLMGPLKWALLVTHDQLSCIKEAVLEIMYTLKKYYILLSWLSHVGNIDETNIICTRDCFDAFNVYVHTNVITNGIVKGSIASPKLFLSFFKSWRQLVWYVAADSSISFTSECRLNFRWWWHSLRKKRRKRWADCVNVNIAQ